MADALLARFCTPFEPAVGSGIPAYTNFTLDGSTDALEYIFQAPPGAASYSITRLGVRLGTITGTTPTYRLSLQGVDGSGNPDGTIKGGGTPASVTFSPSGLGWSNNTWHWVDLDNAYSASPGELLAHVVDYSSGTVDGSNNASFTSTVGTNYTNLAFPYSITNNATVRTKVATAMACRAWGTSSVAYDFPSLSFTSTTYNSGSTPDEYALKWTLPADWGATYKVRGVRVMLGLAAAATMTVKLYDSDGSTVLQDIAWDTDHTTGTSARWKQILFNESSLSSLSFGTAYRIGFVPSSATNHSINYMDVDAAADWDAWPGGQNVLTSTRTDAGAWTDTTTRRLFCELVLADITEPSGGGTTFFVPVE